MALVALVALVAIAAMLPWLHWQHCIGCFGCIVWIGCIGCIGCIGLPWFAFVALLDFFLRFTCYGIKARLVYHGLTSKVGKLNRIKEKWFRSSVITGDTLVSLGCSKTMECSIEKKDFCRNFSNFLNKEREVTDAAIFQHDLG